MSVLSGRVLRMVRGRGAQADGPWCSFMACWLPHRVIDWWFRWHTMGSDGVVYRMTPTEWREFQASDRRPGPCG